MPMEPTPVQGVGLPSLRATWRADPPSSGAYTEKSGDHTDDDI